MSDLFDQTKSEIKQLPYMLGKLFGAVLAVIGVAGLVLIWTGKSGPLLSSLVPYFISAVVGVLLFLRSARKMACRKKGGALQTVPALNPLRMNMIAWALLLVLAITFLLVTYFVTR